MNAPLPSASSVLKPGRTCDRHWHEFNGEFQQHVIGKVVGHYNAVRALHLHCILFCRTILNNFIFWTKFPTQHASINCGWLRDCMCVVAVVLTPRAATRLLLYAYKLTIVFVTQCICNCFGRGPT